MSCNKALNIKNVPVNATWEIEEAFCLSTKNLTIADLKGKYFLFYNAAGTKFKAWFDDGVETEPVVSSTTSITVDIETATTPALIATAIKTAIDGTASAAYTGTITDSTTIKFLYDDTSFVANAPENGTAGAALELTRVQIGGSIDLGLLDGDVSFNPSIETLDVTAHQTGLVVQSQIVTSVGGTVSLTCKEYKTSLYKSIFEAVGGMVPTTQVTGFGTAMIGKNLMTSAKRLKLKPVGSTDDTQNYTFWKAVPELGDITFSGESPNVLPLEFTVYVDESKASAVNVWAFGDVATLP